MDNKKREVNDPSEIFEQLFEKWHARIYQTCFRLMGHPQEAEDITQDVFVRALGAYDRFRGDADPGTWLYRIAVNQCLNARRRKRRIQWLTLDFWNEDDESTTARKPQEAVGENLRQADQKRIITMALNSLPDRQRTALILAHFERMSHKAIAEVLGCSTSAVESLLHRARTNLGKRLRPYLDDL